MNYKVLAVSVLIAIFLLFSIASPTYTGRVVDTLNTEYLLNNLEEVKEDYNANIERVPKFSNINNLPALSDIDDLCRSDLLFDAFCLMDMGAEHDVWLKGINGLS